MASQKKKMLSCREELKIAANVTFEALFPIPRTLYQTISDMSITEDPQKLEKVRQGLRGIETLPDQLVQNVRLPQNVNETDLGFSLLEFAQVKHANN